MFSSHSFHSIVFSVAMLSLYKNINVIPVEDVVNIMVSAQLLKIPRLIQL